MIDIKNIDGSVIFSVLPDEDAVFHEELMSSDYVQLSWVSDEYQVIPAGAYIEYEGEKYKLLENYTPTQQDECTYQYTPQFQSRIMNWDKQITPVYTYESDGTTVKSREMDWEFTGSPADAMYIVKQAIKNETGENWTVQLADSLPATITISSQSSSIYSILNTIAYECETEWWADKKTNTLYLSKCIFGNPITLEVGNNVQVPSVTSDSDGYYTRFYAFGSTRNITQDYDGGQATNSIVNKRLTLNPAKYPNGYKDIKSGLKPDEVFVKVLYFDEIYPSSKLTISDVRARLRYRLDNSGQKVIVGGTEEKPVYEQYAIWYFQIAGFTFDPATDVIEDLNLSASFESGQLAGRDFELTYHESAETVSDSNDITPFEVKAGDYEIVIDETSGQIIPGTSYIIPQDGDSVVLYNIVMPDEYVTSAQNELENALDKAMLSYTEDNNTYQMESDPTRFYENNTDIQMGQAVTYVNGTKSLSTRVQMVEKRLDLSCYQTIKIGNKIIKGNTQQIKDEVASANQNIDVIKAFNDLSTSLSNAYANAQREMIEGFAAIKNLWTLETDENGNNYAYTQYDVFGKGGITSYAVSKAQIPSIYESIPFDNTTIWINPETGLVEVIGGTGGGGEAGSVAWGNITDKPTWITDTKPQYTWTEIQNKPSWITTDKPEYSYTEITGLTDELSKYVTLTTDQSISGMKDFANGMKVSGTLFKVINGVLTLDCSLAVTGGITTYAIGEQTASTIMDGIVCDETTITKSGGKLKVIGGTGGGLDDVTVTGTGNAVTSASLSNNILTLTKGSAFALSEHTHTIADLTNATGLFTALSSSSSTNLSVTVGGTTKTIADLYATTAENSDKLDNLHSTDFCRRYNLGSSVDGEGFYLVLGPAYKSTALTGFSFHGLISMKRGSSGNWHGETLVTCAVGAQYTSNIIRYNVLKDSSIVVNGFYNILYNNTYYLALKVTIASSVEVNLYGVGYNNFNPFLLKQSLGTSETLVSNNTVCSAEYADFGLIEIYAATPYIDFHYGNSNTDYTSRIIETEKGVININNRFYSGLNGQAAVVASCVAANNATEWKTCCFSIAGNTSRQYGLNLWNTQNGVGHIQSGYIKGTTSYFNLALQEFGGNVGIGTMSPSYKLDVNGSTRSYTYHINTGYGTNYISQGTGDGADYTTHNMKIRCHYGLGFYGNDDTCKMFINTREGSLSAKGSISSSIFYINGIKMYKHSDGTVMLDGNLAVTGGVTVYASNSVSYDGFNVQRINIKGTNESNGYISADTSYNMYFNVNSKSLLVLDGNSAVVRPGSSLPNAVDLGSTSVPWKNGYFKGFHINNDSNTLSSDVTLIARPNSSNPYFGMYFNGKIWYIQGYNSVLMLGSGSANSIQITDTGNLKVPGTVSQGSDIRLKTGISTLENRGYITPKTFWKDGIRQIGFIAQEVQALYPELVLEDGSENHYLSLNYSQMVAVLEAQIIELKNKIEELENKLNVA